MTISAVVATAALAVTAALSTSPATAGPREPSRSGEGPRSDVRDVGPDYRHGKKLKIAKAERRALDRAKKGQPVTVGQVRSWPALDDALGRIYLKPYKLRGLGENIEVWVAQDTSFPRHDCRNGLGLADVTKARVNSFVGEFDTNIYPTESDVFSTPQARNGTKALLGKSVKGVPRTQFKGDGDDIVVLVDNIRDDNYYDPSSPDGQTYIAGFFYSLFNEYTDRNVMTIDAYDWLHRTGPNPPDDSADPAYVACTEEQGATRPYGTSRPRLYEGTFAHEYQHLLEHYEDPDETSWVNEGLSDWAQTLVGYVDPAVPPNQPEADGHLSCFQGFQPPGFGGPENSLTLWGDQGDAEILCDYGAAYSIMEYLESHYGESFMTALHREDTGGLEGLQVVLDQFDAGVTAQETLHDWAAAMAVDSVLDANGGALNGGDPAALSAEPLKARINWANRQAFNSPGAPPNGSDYVRLRNSSDGYLSAASIESIEFTGDVSYPTKPVEWTEDTTPPASVSAGDETCGDALADGPGPAALYSGCGEDLDRSIVQRVSVPQGAARLTFDALWDVEPGWDFAFVQVSNDGGASWKSLPASDTTATSDPQAIPLVQDNLPGFTGASGGWRHETVDLSPYAGQSILLGFRYVTDALANEAGFWVRNLSVADTSLSTDPAGWQSQSEAHPTPVDGWTVQLIGYTSDDAPAWVHTLALDGSADGSLSGAAVTDALGSSATTVAAIVTLDDPSETATDNVGYHLTVNGAAQPGG